MKKFIRSATRLPVIAFAAFIYATGVSAQTGPGWIMLFDGQTIPDWDRTNTTNWRVEDGAIVADEKPAKGSAHLVSKKTYKDFQLYVEFWASDDANSGVFLRCSDPTKPSARTCYEVNIYDKRKDPTYGTGAIVFFAEVDPMPKAGGKWNTYEITANGRDITAVLNGEQTAKLRNGLYVEGPITIQYGAGVIKFRKIAIKPL